MDPKIKKCSTIICFPWWANGPYSPGLGSCAGVISSVHPINSFALCGQVQGMEIESYLNAILSADKLQESSMLEDSRGWPHRVNRAHWPTPGE